MTKVLFKFGTKAQYLALEEKLDNALYFLTDTGELYKGSKSIAQSHVYKGEKIGNETSQEALNRIIQDQITVEGDIALIIGNNNTVDTFIKDKNEWTLLNASFDSILSRLSNLELLINDWGTLFKYKGVINSLINVTNPSNGDVYQVGSSEYVWNGEEWIELGTPIDLTNYYTKDEVKDLIGVPSSSYIDETTGNLITVPATGIFEELSKNADKIIPLFNGVISGLVPVLDNELTVQEKSNYFLNALGNWVTINTSIGQYIAPDGTTFTDVEKYVEYMVENYAEMIWETME